MDRAPHDNEVQPGLRVHLLLAYVQQLSLGHGEVDTDSVAAEVEPDAGVAINYFQSQPLLFLGA